MAVVSFAGERVQLVAHSDVQREAGQHAPVVLGVESGQIAAYVGKSIHQIADHGSRIAEQEAGKRRAAAAIVAGVVAVELEFAAAAARMAVAAARRRRFPDCSR